MILYCCFQVNWALVQLFKAVYYLNKNAKEESLDLYLGSVFKKILFTKSLAFSKKNKKQNKIKFWTFV